MTNTANTPKVTKRDTLTRTGGKICGTRVEMQGRVIDFCGRMTKKEAVRQAAEYLRRESIFTQAAM